MIFFTQSLQEEHHSTQAKLEAKTREAEEIQADLDKVIKEMATLKENVATVTDDKERCKRELDKQTEECRVCVCCSPRFGIRDWDS